MDKWLIIAVMLFAATLTTTAWADSCPAVANPDLGNYCRFHKCQSLSWKINKGHIDTNSLCSTYKSTSIEYKDCRGYAKHYFEDRCEKYKQAARSNKLAVPCKEMYCSAANMRP